MRRIALFVLTVGLLGALLPAASAVAELPPDYRQERVYFTCSGTTKVHNVNRQGLNEPMAGWDTTAPTQSVSAGAGCGYLDPGFLADTGGENGGYGDGAWSGTFTGNLRDLNVELHNIGPSLARAGACAYTMTPRLYVDGAALTETTDVEGIVTPSSTGASDKVEFSIASIDIFERNADGTPVPGTGSVEHTVTLAIGSVYVDCGTMHAWVYDTTEVPAGIDFNPAQLTGARINV